ncbi:MAG TPA: 8-amino-7-oxononanoate synthase [Acidimicrobiales bacterium]|nr:8-amino-7-oxononanoate synthase [Acidimicrobiales bacterium]
MTWSAWATAENERVAAAGRWRVVRAVDRGGVTGVVDGRQVVSFASNDYLGLTQHPAVIAAAHDALDRYGTGSGSARLIVGGRPLHDELEAELAAWKRQERALLFPTGFAANLGVLSVLGGAGVTICSDELNHASIIDGARLAKAHVEVYRHGDLDHLDKLLADAERAIVVTDSVFSMDGDVADLAALSSICASHGALLVLDEAHAVLGPDRVDDTVEVLCVGTLSKTLASLGGYVAGPASLVDLLRNRARSFIFTTASTPADTAVALAALRIVCSPQGDELRARLRAHVERVRPGHPSPIVPVVLGDEQRALDASAALLERGILVPAIRPPTVPVGSSRLRIALSAAHSDEHVTRLLDALA